MVNLSTFSPKLRKHSQEALRFGGGNTPISPPSTPANSFGHGRSGQGKRKHPLSIFTSNDGSASRGGDRKHEEVTVHNAAIRSATDLSVNVTNSMLRSPLISSPLPTRLRSARLAPITGRPRSNTAPTTPVYDVYPMEPAELEGSLPGQLDSDSTGGRSMDDQPGRDAVLTPRRGAASFEMYRPSTESPARRDFLSMSPEHMHPNGLAELNGTGENLSDTQDHDLSSSAGRSARPSVSTLQGASSTFSSLQNTDIVPGSRPGTAPQMQTSISPMSSQRQTYPLQPPQQQQLQAPQLLLPLDSEAALMDQISFIRNANDAHLALVKEAHEKEIASYRSYVAFLEKRRAPNASPLHAQASQQTLAREPLSATASKSGDIPRSDTPNNYSRPDAAHEHGKRPSQDSSIDVDVLKRKLRDTVERSERKIGQLKDIVKRFKESDQTLTVSLANVEARLEIANMERVDVLDGFNNAQQIIRELSEREKSLTLEREELLAKVYREPTAELPLDTTMNTTVEKQGSPNVRKVIEEGPSGLKNDLFLQQLVELKKTIKEKDTKIRELEQSVTKLGSNSDEIDTTEHPRIVAALTRQLEDCQSRLQKAEAERDQHHEVLRAELRRQSRYAIQNSSVALTPQIGAEASALANEKLGLYPKAESGDAATNGSPSSQSMREDLLEKELRHVFSEIIAYKLDIRGYKKDLKKANATIQTLQTQATALQIPPTPDSITGGSTKRRHRHASTSSGKERRSGGLGISLTDEPKAPTRSSTNATSTSFFSTRSAPPLTNSARKDKTLPRLPSAKTLGPAKPLSRPSSPDQGTHPHRSLSESIVSPGIKPQVSERIHVTTPPTRGRSCEPLVESPRGVPTSKFSMAEGLPAN